MEDDDRAITEALRRWSEIGRPGLDEDLMPLVYRDLRRLSGVAMSSERPNHTLSPTALVSELYLRLSQLRKSSWKHRGQFFAFVKLRLTQILKDHGRRRNTIGRGRGWKRSDDEIDKVTDDAPILSHLALQELLASIKRKDEQLYRLIQLKFFGRTEEEISAELGIATATVTRRWKFAYRLLTTALKHN